MNTIIRLFLIFFICDSILAATALSNGYIGISKNQMNSKSQQNGVVLGLDGYPWMIGQSGFGLGFGVEANFFGTDVNGVGSGYSAYTLDATAKIGYTFEQNYNIPLTIKAGIGYGVLDVETSDGWGTHYEANTEYRLLGQYGIGLKYKSMNSNVFGTDVKVKSSMFYISKHF